MSTNPSSRFRLPRPSAAALAVLCIPAALSAAEPLASATPHVAVEARLLTPISTYSARRGMPISAAIITPLCGGGARIVPAGAELRGVVAGVRKVGLGLVHESAGLRLHFNQLVLPDGSDYVVATRLFGIDNARESVGKKGYIDGIRATATISNRLGERIAFAVLGHPAAMVPLFVLESGVFHFPDPEIEFGRGTVLRLNLEPPEQLQGLAACPMPEEPSTPAEWLAVQQAVDELPYWTYSKRQSQPMDLVNLLFEGSQDELQRAFTAAGWTGSRDNSMGAGVAAIRAIVQETSYADAPMRTLLLDGEEPQLRLQKSLDTFEKRDHLRIWKRPERLEGRELWASAATRDVGTTFGMHPFGFTHEIQDDVDLERDTVVHDLVFTGCVDSVAYVQRPEGLRETGGQYRKGVSTDARVALVTLNACTQPRENFAAVEPGPQPGTLVRVIRRITLTARNHFIRDNLFYRSADAARLSYLALRNLDRQAKGERRARRIEAAAHDGAASGN